jgi:hypothetical protein
MNIPVRQVIKFIKSVYSPTEISHEVKEMGDGKPEHYIHLYFDEIPDSYITNPNTSDPIANKEKNLESDIRRNIRNYFGIYTSGFDVSIPGISRSPHKKLGITIFVVSRRN